MRLVQCLPRHDAAVSVVVFVCLVSCLCLCDCVSLCLSVVIRDPVHARSRYCPSVIEHAQVRPCGLCSVCPDTLPAVLVLVYLCLFVSVSVIVCLSRLSVCLSVRVSFYNKCECQVCVCCSFAALVGVRFVSVQVVLRRQSNFDTCFLLVRSYI